jgi:hypothetical protein
MTIVTATPPDLARVIEVFPEDVPLIRRLFLADRAFRGACEDYRLACEGLHAFARRRHDEPRPEIEEYERLVRELEAEMREMINAARGRT